MSEAAQTETTDPLDPITVIGNRVLEQLKTVHDPEIPVNIYDLGLIYKIDIEPGIETGRYDIHIDMTLTTPNCPVAGTMPAMVEAAVGKIEEFDKIKIDLVWEPSWDKSRMSDVARMKLNMF
jgi:FeS assembly SUF system protein